MSAPNPRSFGLDPQHVISSRWHRHTAVFDVWSCTVDGHERYDENGVREHHEVRHTGAR